jgi:guanine deaminase
MESCVYPAEERFESVEIAKDASARFFHDLKANGTTTACVYNTIHQEATDKAFEQAEISGLRILMGKVMMDQNSPASLTEKTNESLHTSEELCSKWHNKDDGRLNYVFTPRFAPACSRQLMKEVSKLASKHGAYIQTHLAENRQELELVKTLFPECKNYAQVYEDAGLLGPKSIMAHCIHLDDIEISLLKNRRAKVAHCPSSNLFLKSGIFNMRRFMDGAQIDIGLGSDVAGGPILSIFQEMANACYVSKINDFSTEGRVRAIDPVYAFYLATLGGAKVLSQDSKIGSLSPDKEADFIVLDTEQIDPLKKEQHNANRNPREILSQLVYRWPLTKVESTFIRGSKVYCNENEND